LKLGSALASVAAARVCEATKVMSALDHTHYR